MSWKEFPKVELHLHLEGAAPPAFIRGLAAEKKIDLTGVFDEHGHYAYRDFDHFLKVYEAATEALKTPDDFKRLTQAVLEELAEHNVVYAETFVSPDFCGGGDVGAWREYLAAMQEAHVDGVTLKGIVTCIRHFGPEQAKTAALCAAETHGDFILGFGIAGAELVGTARDYLWSFDCAREAGLRLTAHAGEWGAPDTVRATWKDLGVERLGHGVRASEDPALVDDLAETGVVLEVCPGSNVALGLYPDVAHHPIARLRDRGVKVTVSTDDPPFFHTTMTKEFENLERAFRWGAEDFDALNRTALEAAFCDDETKARVAKQLDEATP
ncbi:adenosine deaminase [Shimia ponticola]|uniref:adenosine deaminase n=1 Tax=Shimia ponticola TaxID=2582893 RepID=UPI0011BDF5FC|nr:adenosine deaminase [Shimia ponticola]